MCYTKYFKHPKCGCWSVRISRSCKKGRNFQNCPTFENGIARNPKNHPREVAEKGKCPWHNKKGANRKKEQMVSGVKRGVKWGLGPNEGDFGIDILCGDPKGLRKKKRKPKSDSEESDSEDSAEEDSPEEDSEEESEEEEEEEERGRRRKSKPEYQIMLCTVM